MRQYAKTVLGVQFRHDTSEYADGVLWIAWRESNEKRPRSKDEIAEELRVVNLVTQVIATVNLIYQYCDADEAFNTLPFKEDASMRRRTKSPRASK